MINFTHYKVMKIFILDLSSAVEPLKKDRYRARKKTRWIHQPYTPSTIDRAIDKLSSLSKYEVSLHLMMAHMVMQLLS